MSHKSRRFAKILTGVVIVAVLAAVITVSVKAVNGDYSGNYEITGYFSRAGAGMQAGTEVDYRGVQVGRVLSAGLRSGMARVVLSMDPGFKVPADASAIIEPLNLFGAERISLEMPSGRRPPYLAAGQAIRNTSVSDQLGRLFQAADPLLAKIDATKLSGVISELYQASAGEGPRIVASIQATNKLASLLSATLPAQLAALDSLATFSGYLAPTGPSFNSMAVSENKLLPLFDNEQAAYDRLLTTLTSMSDSISALLLEYRPDIATLMVQGANVSRLLLVRQQNIGHVVDGLLVFITRQASASTGVLPNGNHYTYLATFVEFSDLKNLLCELIGAAGSPGGGAVLPGLQQALEGAGNQLGCSIPSPAPSLPAPYGASQVAGPSNPVGGGTQQPSSLPAQLPQPIGKALQGLAQNLYQTLSNPQVPVDLPGGRALSTIMGGVL